MNFFLKKGKSKISDFFECIIPYVRKLIGVVLKHIFQKLSELYKNL